MAKFVGNLLLLLYQTLTGTSTTESTTPWTVDFERRSFKTTKTPQTHSIILTARNAPAKWHVRVTFCGEPQIGLETNKNPDWTKRWDGFRKFC
jgi:hypothetical protein